MKKVRIIPALFLSAGIIYLSSCGSEGNNKELKAPGQQTSDTTRGKEAGEKNENEENEKNEQTPGTKPATLITSNTGSVVMENMKSAYKGEMNASAKYAAYARQAEKEGYHSIALLFKAASASENIHASNHKAVLQEANAVIPEVKPAFDIRTTKENLQDAIAGETYEVTTMYPGFLATANEAKNQLALISLNYAYKTEKKHKLFYEAALGALENNTVSSLPALYYICPTCGNTYETKAPARCGISMTSAEKFIKISSL